jgi:aspartate/methionine/tyrosine aminotransferase
VSGWRQGHEVSARTGSGGLADELAARLLDETGVAVLAGSAFGQMGKDHLRLSYANSQRNLTLALERIREFVEAL